MGNASAGSAKPKACVDRAGMDEDDYQKLRAALEVSEDSATALVELPVFLARFPPHLRPLVQPLFFQFSRTTEEAASASQQSTTKQTGDLESAVPWPLVVRGFAMLCQHGASWSTLLDLWEGADARASADLAARLCFWCAHPSLGPTASDGAASDTNSSADPVDSALAILPTAAEIVALSEQLQRDIPRLPGRVVPRLRQALLNVPPLHDLPAPESRILDAGLSFALRGATAQLWESAAWHPLYRSWKDGRSFSGFLKGASSYPGLAVIVVRTAEGPVIGALSNCWEEGLGRFGGTSDCMLFALQPTLTICRTTGKSSNYGYLNSKSTYSNRGVGFGGQAEMCRLWIDADFDCGHVLKSDSTYQKGDLIAGDDYLTPFKISQLEVWGCSGSDALDQQSAFKERMGAAREQAKKCDRSRLVENDFDKEMFFGNTFAATKDARPLADDVDE